VPTVININNHDGILQQFESSEQAAAQLIAGVFRRQMNWQPNGGASWSIWQCLDHLTRTNRVYCRSMLEALAHAKKRGKGTGRPGRKKTDPALTLYRLSTMN